MKTSNKNIRLNWIDYARGIAIILVVYRHMFEGLKNTQALKDAGVDVSSYLYLENANIFFFSFRMPLFFLVSGVFIGASLAKRGFNSLMTNKVRTILYPYFLWGIIQITIQIVFSAFTNSDKSFNDYTYLLYLPREVEQFWYLYALFNVTVLYAFLKSQTGLNYVHHIGIGLVLFFTSAFFSQYGIELGFISDIFHYYLFFAIGDAISSTVINGRLRQFFFSWKAFFILIIPFVLSQYYFLHTNLDHVTQSPKYLYVEYYQPVMYIIIALTGCAFIVSISSLLERYDTARWLNSLGKHSLYIYVLHVIIFAGTRILLTRFLGIYNVPLLMLICISAGVIIPIFIYKLTEKLGWQFLFSLEPRDKKNKKLQPTPIRNPVST